MLVTTFSGAITVLLGLQGLESIRAAPLLAKNSALVLSALVTLLTAWDAFFNHRALWVRYTRTVTELRGIQSELEYVSSDSDQKPKEADIDRLFERYQSALKETNVSWQTLRDDGSPKEASH